VGDCCRFHSKAKIMAEISSVLEDEVVKPQNSGADAVHTAGP